MGIDPAFLRLVQVGSLKSLLKRVYASGYALRHSHIPCDNLLEQNHPRPFSKDDCRECVGRRLWVGADQLTHGALFENVRCLNVKNRHVGGGLS